MNRYVLMLFFLLLTTLCTPANVSGDPDVLSSLKVIRWFCCGLILACWVIDLKNHTLFTVYGWKHNPLSSNMWVYIHTYTTTTAALISPLSVLLNTHTCTKDCLLAVSWPFHPAVLPHSWPTAWLVQLCWCWWVGLLSGWGNMGGFITPSPKFSSADWGPSGKEERCHRGLALQLLTVCLCEIEWVSICLCHAGLCYHNLFRSLTCLGDVRTVHSWLSFRNE